MSTNGRIALSMCSDWSTFRCKVPFGVNVYKPGIKNAFVDNRHDKFVLIFQEVHFFVLKFKIEVVDISD